MKNLLIIVSLLTLSCCKRNEDESKKDISSDSDFNIKYNGNILQNFFMKYEDSLKYSLAKNQIPLFLLDKNFDNDHSGFWPTLSDTIHFKSYIINRINSCTELNKLNELIDSVNSVNKNEVDSVIMKDLKERQLSLGCNLIR